MTGKAKQEMLRMETAARFPYLIEVTTPDGVVHRFCNSADDITFSGNVYTASCFNIELPEVKNGEVGNASISLSTVDQEWIVAVRSMQARSHLKFVAVIMYENGAVTSIEEMEQREFTLTQVSWQEPILKWTMVFDELADIQIPVDECNRFVCPALA